MGKYLIPVLFLKEPEHLDAILKKSSEKAQDLACAHMNEIKDIVGFLRL